CAAYVQRVAMQDLCRGDSGRKGRIRTIAGRCRYQEGRLRMQLRLHAFDLPLRHTFTISRESISSQPTLIIELIQDGISGYGEATSNKYYGFTIERMARDLAPLRPQLEGAQLSDPAALCAALA